MFENQGLAIEQYSDVISPWANEESLGTRREVHKTYLKYMHDQYHEFHVKNSKRYF